MTLTHNDHFQFTYDGGKTWQTRRTSAPEAYAVRYGRCDTVLSWRAANTLAARTIRDDSTGDLTLFLSGGIDSEVMALAFQDAKIKVTHCIFRFRGGLNDHDTKYAFDYCTKHGIVPWIIDVEISDYLDGADVLDRAKRTQSLWPEHVVHQWFTTQVSDTPVLGIGDLFVIKDVPANYVPGVSAYPRTTWSHREYESFSSHRRHDRAVAFFRYLPEQMLAYLSMPAIQPLLADEWTGKLSHESSKHRIMSSEYPELAPRKKYTGFEYVDLRRIMKRIADGVTHAGEPDETGRLTAQYRIEIGRLRDALMGKATKDRALGEFRDRNL